MSDAAIGCLRFDATLAREVSVTRGRVFFYGVRKLLGVAFWLLPDVVGCSNLFNSLRDNTNIRPNNGIFKTFRFENIREH